MYIDFNTETSSLKGESLEETLLTLRHQGVDLCIIRTSVSHQFDEFKLILPSVLLMAVMVSNQHPSQALLDLMTFIDDGGEIHGKTLAIIGDCIHSRVAIA